MKTSLLILLGVLLLTGVGAYVEHISHSSVDSADLPSKKRPLQLTEASSASFLSKEQQVMMNDPAIHQAWGLKKSDAARAWEVSQGSRNVIVAVIDTGIDKNHEDLSGNLWRNPGESGLDDMGRNKASNGKDDDGNGFVDDVSGWNFVANNSDLTDNHGHGTHIAGIIGAEAGNGKGIAGIAPQVSLMVLKYYDPKVPGTDNLKNTVNAIKYAVKMKAQIINYSGGGTEFSKDEYEAIEEARKQGVLFVAAAGNERSNSDKNKYYPADYGLSNIISVTAIDPSTEVLSSSNYGVETVDIAAPGQNILSTLPNNAYGYMTGTSQATAFATGAAVLAMAHKGLTLGEDVKKFILRTGDANQSLLAKCRTSKQLNLFKVLTVKDSDEGASGVVAANTTDLHQKFTVDSNSQTQRGISGFGKDLMQTLEHKSLSKKN
ncbi:MAG: S8 family peptidase [Pseudobdellovibrionaceae bacterium]